MNKADELLPTVVAGLEWAMRKVAVSPNEYHSDLYRREYHAANHALFQARAYLNEKPHEPIKDAGVSHGKASDGSLPTEAVPASPPHAAAEPEKPVAWMYEHPAVPGPPACTTLRWFPRDGWTETPLYASPSAQPIAEHTHRWNVEESDNDVRICRGFHQNGEECDWEYFVPKSAAQPIARDEQDAKRYRWLMDVWDEACPFANGLPLWDYDSSMVNAAIDHERLAEKGKGG